MKRKLCIGLALAALVIPRKSYALIGEDLAALWQMVQQGSKMISQADQAYQQTRMQAAFVRSPGYWKQAVANAASGIGSTLGNPSTGNDLAALAQMAEGQHTAMEAMRQIASDPGYQPTAENTAAVSLLHLQTVETTIRMNELKDTLQYQQLAQQYRAADPGFQQTAGDINTWHLKQ